MIVKVVEKNKIARLGLEFLLSLAHSLKIRLREGGLLQPNSVYEIFFLVSHIDQDATFKHASPSRTPVIYTIDTATMVN